MLTSQEVRESLVDLHVVILKFLGHAVRGLQLHAGCACDRRCLWSVQAKVEKEFLTLQPNMHKAAYKVKVEEDKQAEDSRRLSKLEGQQQALQEALQSMEAMRTYES